MKILGFNYTKISAERNKAKEAKEKQIKIRQDVEFTDIEKHDVELIKESNILKISFKYLVEYEPKAAEIILEGVVLLSLDAEMAKEALKAWKKKQMIEPLRLPLANLVINKCSLKALVLEEELNLRPHMRLVKVNVSESN